MLMYQVLFKIPLHTPWFDGIPIYGFGTMLVLALFLCTWLAGRRAKQEGIARGYADCGSAIPMRRMRGDGQPAPKLRPAISAGEERDRPDVLRRRKGCRRRASMVLSAASLSAAVLLVVSGTVRPHGDSPGPVSARKHVRRVLGDF